ncbi:MAG TPA: FecR domain-containing protein [Sideroxyarcus sp.]|nr:FecR domain-containing protein [Sideroxyarcus sp.]
MRIQGLMVPLLAGVCGALAAGGSLAGEAIEVVKAEGAVEVRQQERRATEAVRSKSVLPEKNVLTTGPNGRAVVKVGETGFIVVEKNSTVEINKSGGAGIFRHVTGIVYYMMNKVRGGKPPVEVRAAAATIGVRGTRFLVADTADRKEIGMRKGLISVTSPGEEYEIHRQAEQDEFAAFKKEAADAIKEEKRQFSEYKKNEEREFIEYKREFTLGANRMASFDGKRVTERALSAESKEEMESLEDYAAEWIKEVQD